MKSAGQAAESKNGADADHPYMPRDGDFPCFRWMDPLSSFMSMRNGRPRLRDSHGRIINVPLTGELIWVDLGLQTTGELLIAHGGKLEVDTWRSTLTACSEYVRNDNSKRQMDSMVSSVLTTLLAIDQRIRDGDLEQETLCRDLWCVYAFECLDRAIGCSLHGRDIDALLPTAETYGALGNLRTLRQLGTRTFSFMGQARVAEARKKGTASRTALYANARRWIWNEWIAHHHAYDSNKTAFARDYVRLAAQRFETKTGDPLKLSIDTITDKYLSQPPDVNA